MTHPRNHGFFAMKQDSAPRRVILAFRAEFNFMSNFTACRVTLPAEPGLPALEFNSTEQAYMAWKTKDHATRLLIQQMTPGDAKTFTHQDGFPLRDDYSDQGRIDIMLDLTRQKYSTQNPDLRDKLIATGDAVLIEGNEWGDTFFGFSYPDGHGKNHLGRILMTVRREIGGA